MTEPDEATVYARERAKERRSAPNNPHRDISAEIDAGKHDDELSDEAHGYRAGQAASAERIKALEAFLRHLREWDQMNPPMTGDHAAHAASIDALLKETDR